MIGGKHQLAGIAVQKKQDNFSALCNRRDSGGASVLIACSRRFRLWIEESSYY